MRHVFALAALGLMLTACGEAPGARDGPGAGETRAAGTEGGQGPCSWITQAEMGEVLGAPVTRQEEQAGTRCIYYTDDPLVYVDLEVDQRSAAESWEGITAGNSLVGAEQDSLGGIGDRAFFGPRDRLYVLRGNTFLAIEAGFDDQPRERARRVATLALSRVR